MLRLRGRSITGKRLLLLAAVLTIVPISTPTNTFAAVRGFVVVGGPYVGGWYGPHWVPYWGPYYWGPYGGYCYYPNSGTVKLEPKVKNAQVFLNGAYAGTTRENRTMHLRPGMYKVTVREAGRTHYAQNIYVVARRTLHLYPEL